MITREFNLYLHAGHSIPLVINANQYDRGEQWLFTLFNSDGTKYVPSSGAIVGIKSDKLGIINSGTVDSQGRVVINETQQMTAAVGKAVFELLIDDQSHGTANFIVLVEPKPGDQADLSESDLSLIQQAIDGTSATAIAQGVSDWMDDNLTPTTPVVDTSLTVSGAAADSAKVGQEISDLKSQIAQSEGMTADVKQALMDIAEHIKVWTDGNAQTYVENLRTALYPPANLVSITAVYTQSGTVYDNQTLDSLKSDLVVTANYDNGTSETVTNYTLSGELTTGERTITVAFGGKTATFTVTVTHATAQYTILNSLTNCTNSNSATVVNEETEYTGTLTADTGYILATVTITMGGVDITATAYDSSDGSISIAEVTGNVVITAEAVEDVGWISGVPYEITWTKGSIDQTTGAFTPDETKSGVYSNLLPCAGVSAFNFGEGIYIPTSYVYFYDSEQNLITRSGRANPCHSAQTCAYIRVVRNSTTDATVTPLKYPLIDEQTAWVSGTYYEMPFTKNSSSSFTLGKILCVGASHIKISDSSRHTHYFYDVNNNQIAIATGTTTYYTVPEGAYYFKVECGYGYTKLDRVWCCLD